jgi:hypothetical protein
MNMTARWQWPAAGEQPMSARRAAAMLFLLGGCGDEELPGLYWDLIVEGTDNQCTGGGANYSQRYEYRVLFEGNDITVAVDEDIFATGTVDGCLLTYSSVVWSSYRENHEIQWQILGSAYVNAGGGGGCVDDTDWQGTETFVITSSDHPSVSAGCTYETEVTGGFTREVE